jgi:hypothetical protein
MAVIFRSTTVLKRTKSGTTSRKCCSSNSVIVRRSRHPTKKPRHASVSVTSKTKMRLQRRTMPTSKKWVTYRRQSAVQTEPDMAPLPLLNNHSGEIYFMVKQSGSGAVRKTRSLRNAGYEAVQIVVDS